WMATGGGALVACTAILLEIRFKKVSLKRLLGLAAGLLAGLCCAALTSIVLGRLGLDGTPLLRLITVFNLVLFAWFGAGLGAAKGDLLTFGALGGGVVAAEADVRLGYRILDTSVIIDGRIADIVEAGFLDGVLVVPQFVLHELQMVADSADGMKRARGRRGLDVLQRIQKMSHVTVEVIAQDFPGVKEVDMKLIELATLYGCCIVTNDFNLNKVAQVRGVKVLNINELANSVRPVVLPGELMRVFILKEGKEYNQGVAYLDDGTMVVVDNARRMISKTIDISVTSVLQTTAGKMIFGKFDDRHAVHQVAQAVAQTVTQATPVTERAAVRIQAVGE
ncbi:MAG: PilT protein domain protein, partial [Bryobacterales bacterium]|nr:PilT protein domain protein [Bryobacterales bacterium]